MNLSYLATITAVLQVFMIGLVGYLLVKKGIIDHQGLNLLARLAIGLFYPVLVFTQFTKYFSFVEYPRWWIFPLIFFLMGAVAFVLSRIVVLFYPAFPYRRELSMVLVFQNCGYVPLLLSSTIFSGEILQRMLIDIFLFCMGFDVLLWSFGIWFLTKQKMERGQFKNFLNPPLVAVILSLLCAYFGLSQKIPLLFLKPLEMLSQCALPVGMMVVGGSLATIRIADTKKRDMSIVLLIKLILLPFLALGTAIFLKLEFLLGFLVVLQAAVPSAMTLSVVARHYGGDEKFINQSIFFSHLFSMVTMPAFLILYAHLTKGA